VEAQQDRFESAVLKNSDSFRVMPRVEFKPFALISGSAAVGYREINFLNGPVPAFKGPVAQVDLQYIFRNRTQFSVSANRDLDYSYLDLAVYYVNTGVSASVTQRLGDRWDVRGTVGRYWLSYPDIGAAAGYPSELGLAPAGEVGYRFGRSRVGVELAYLRRTPQASLLPGYNRLVITTSLAYVF
jgi:hypothetical protein